MIPRNEEGLLGHLGLPRGQIARRTFLRASVPAASALLGIGVGNLPAARAIDFAEPVAGSGGLTSYCANKQAMIRWNNVVVAAYRAHGSQKFPYLSCLAGPVTGTPVTTESSLPYPHHRGIWLGCEPLNGGDFWSDGPLDTGQIKSTALEISTPVAGTALISDKCQWIGPKSAAMCSDERTFTISFPSERLRLIDVDIKLTAHEDLVFKRAKHSFFALRAAPDISPIYGGVLMNSSGDTGANATFGKTAAWCCYFGPRQVQPEVVEGIALMDHPENPWNPCQWLTRDYGHLSPSPFFFRDRPWQLDRGNTIRLRYRIAVHAGNPKEAKLSQLHKDWVG